MNSCAYASEGILVYCILGYVLNDTEMALKYQDDILKIQKNALDGLLYSAVGCEGLQLLLNSCQRVGKFLVTDDGDGLLYPVQQV